MDLENNFDIKEELDEQLYEANTTKNNNNMPNEDIIKELENISLSYYDGLKKEIEETDHIGKSR